MARSDAQKAADKRYRETHKGDLIRWGTSFKPAEFADIEATLKQSGMNRAEFIRWAVAKLKEQ